MMIYGMRVFLTGASSGLGEALAWELARRGATCTLAARRRDRLETVAGQIAATHAGAATPSAVACDVADRDSVATAITAAARRMGGIDLLINNAGVSVYGETERTTARDLDEVLAVNFLGCVHAMQSVLPHLRRQGGGHIVNIASLAAIHGVPYLAAYGASKAALAAYSQSLRAEVAHEGIGVQVIYPGYTQTPIFASERKLGGARRPQPPYAPVDEVARLIVNAIEHGKPEVVLSARGRWLALLHGIMPRVLDRIMGRMARRLGENEERCHA